MTRNVPTQGGIRTSRHVAHKAALVAPLVAVLGALGLPVFAHATANTWTTVAPMPGGGRGWLTAATGPDGRIYAIGGLDASNWLDRVEAYDTSTNTWTLEAAMPGGGRGVLASATGPDGRIYAIGGQNGSILDRVEAYDTTTNTWTTETPMPGGGRAWVSAATGPDGRIYVIGGYDGSRLNRVEAYDTSTNTWTTEAPMPGGGRSDLSAVTGPDGRIYAIGGSDGTQLLSRLEAYDTNSNTWTTLASMPAGARGDFAAALGPDGRIYAIGGANGPGGSGPLATVEAYNPSTNTWTSAQSMAGGPRSFVAGATGPDGRIYAIGGYDGTNYVALNEAYTVVGGRLSSTGAAVAATENQSFSGMKVAGFTDADENSSASAYSASINWGDTTTTAGSVAADGSGGYAVLGGHAYTEEGSYVISVHITDLDGSSTTATGSSTVADAALSATGLHLKQVMDGVSGVLAKFSDADAGGAIGDYTATINWGDGKVSTGTVAMSGSGFTVSGNHHYFKDREKAAIKVTVRDAGGSTATVWTIARE